MRGKKWLILLTSLALVFLASSLGVTRGSFFDLESSAGNAFQAWASNLWRQTTQAEFNAGVLTNVDTSSSPGDVKLAGQGTQQVAIAFDDFESGGWSGGTGWLWDWWHEGSADITKTENPNGKYHLRLMAADGYVNRPTDLSEQSNVHLQFWGEAKSFEPGEFAQCLVSPDGINWTPVKTWVDGDDDNQYHFYDIDLSGFTMSSQFYVAFDAEMSDKHDYLYIDDVTLVAPATVYYSLGTIASQVLDTGVPGARWDSLFWDEILESGTDITFEVRASDSPFAKDTPPGTLPWIPVGGTSPVTSGLPSGRYMQWQATLTTSDTLKTPTLQEVRVYYY